MQRREFLFSVAAVGLTPALPVGAGAASAKTVVMRGPMIKWAETVAKTQNFSSPSMLQRYLKVGASEASALHSHLVESRIVVADALGVHRAAQPINWNVLKSPSPNVEKLMKQAKELLLEEPQDETETGEEAVETVEVSAEPAPQPPARSEQDNQK